MRLLLALPCALLLACGPKVAMDPSPWEEDDPRAGEPLADRKPTFDELPVAPVGPGVREGSIERTDLVAILDGSPGVLFRHVEVTAELDGDRFLGWRVMGFAPESKLFVGVDLHPDDVVIAANGKQISRPDQLQTIWDELRTADRLVVDVMRGDTRLSLALAILGPATPAPAEPAPAPVKP